jgi:hypothetical protein
LNAVVSVDFGAASWRSLGVAVLRESDSGFACELARESLTGEPDPARLALLVARCGRAVRARHVLLDGPQAWKDEHNGLAHQRSCEKELATQAKTGPPGQCLPRTQLRFVAFSVALFDHLADLGFPRFDPARPDEPAAVEVWPTACWKRLGAKPLPGERRTQPSDMRERREWLEQGIGLSLAAEPSHHELQAAVGGVAGLALAGCAGLGWRAHGVAPYQLDGVWREGVIVVPEVSNSSR